ncbi:preprotein translocase subunit SecE [bacterium]|nr:preprotein translocase subunit SecE [bacterium]MBU1025670.1 preprotein translocase subunit SecE [bacterium]
MVRKRKRSKDKSVQQPIDIVQAETGKTQSQEDVQPSPKTPVVAKKTTAGQSQPKSAAKKVPSASQKMGSFIKDVRAELKKVSWPDQERTIQSTGVVIFTLFALSAAMTAFTMIFTKVAGYFFGTD